MRTPGQRILRDWDHAIKHLRRTALNSPQRSFWSWVCNAYQANATGTGVVNHGYYEGLQELTNELIDSLKLSIVIDDEE